MPFKENQWYFVKLGCVGNTSDGYLYDNATRIDMGVTRKDLSTTNYLWKFEGDPLNGYTLTSANGHKLVTPTVSGNGGTTFAYAASNAPTNGFDTWVAYKPTSTDITNNKGFFLAVKDHATWKLNSRDVPNTTKKLYHSGLKVRIKVLQFLSTPPFPKSHSTPLTIRTTPLTTCLSQLKPLRA